MAPADLCEVWWAHPVAVPERLPELLEDSERARYQRFPHPPDAARYLTARALTRILLGRLLGMGAGAVPLAAACRICGGPHGKLEVVTDSAVEISVSHTGGLVAVAISPAAPVGVDVERLRPLADVARLADRVLSVIEQAQLDARPEAQRPVALLGYWTRKEAILKATGDGLTVPLADLSVSPPGEPPRLLSWTGERAPNRPVWLHELAPGPSHVAHLAVLADTSPEVVEHDGDPLLRD